MCFRTRGLVKEVEMHPIFDRGQLKLNFLRKKKDNRSVIKFLLPCFGMYLNPERQNAGTSERRNAGMSEYLSPEHRNT